MHCQQEGNVLSEVEQAEPHYVRRCESCLRCRPSSMTLREDDVRSFVISPVQRWSSCPCSLLFLIVLLRYITLLMLPVKGTYVLHYIQYLLTVLHLPSWLPVSVTLMCLIQLLCGYQTCQLQNRMSDICTLTGAVHLQSAPSIAGGGPHYPRYQHQTSCVASLS